MAAGPPPLPPSLPPQAPAAVSCRVSFQRTERAGSAASLPALCRDWQEILRQGRICSALLSPSAFLQESGHPTPPTVRGKLSPGGAEEGSKGWRPNPKLLSGVVVSAGERAQRGAADPTGWILSSPLGKDPEAERRPSGERQPWLGPSGGHFSPALQGVEAAADVGLPESWRVGSSGDLLSWTSHLATTRTVPLKRGTPRSGPSWEAVLFLPWFPVQPAQVEASSS